MHGYGVYTFGKAFETDGYILPPGFRMEGDWNESEFVGTYDINEF